MVLVFPAALLTAVSLVVAILWRIALALLRRRAPGFWRRTLRWHAGLFAFHLFVTLPVALGVALPRLAGTRGDERAYRGPLLSADGSWQIQTRESLAAEAAAGGDAAEPAPLRHAVSFQARDGVRLRGFLVPSTRAPEAGGPRCVAVLVHGLFRGALELEVPASMLRDLGAEVLLLELRNHGGSARAPLTLGLDESLDVLAAVDFLRQRPETAGRPLVLFAVSLGTAAAALAAPQIPDLAGLVLDAPMDDAWATARRALGNGSLLSSIREPWATTLLLSARYLGGVSLDRVRPSQALLELSPDTAVLLVGAGRDRRMPPDIVRALFESLPTPEARKRLWIEPEATHGKVWVSSPDEYRRQLAWLSDAAAGGPE